MTYTKGWRIKKKSKQVAKHKRYFSFLTSLKDNLVNFTKKEGIAILHKFFQKFEKGIFYKTSITLVSKPDRYNKKTIQQLKNIDRMSYKTAYARVYFGSNKL